jgi:Cu(I)/Ag(I) efflux system membrane fusion protein
MTAVFNRMTELRSSEAAENTAAKPDAIWKLSDEDRQKLQALVDVADGIGKSLAEDNLQGFIQYQSQLPGALSPLEKAFGPAHPWSGLLERLTQASKMPPAKNLVEARKQFLPFSSAMVELAKQLRKETTAFAALKVFHCPMAPKPGLWIQTKGPLANPFYGASMLRCGEEVKPEGELALRQTARPE